MDDLEVLASLADPEQHSQCGSSSTVCGAVDEAIVGLDERRCRQAAFQVVAAAPGGKGKQPGELAAGRDLKYGAALGEFTANFRCTV